ncbi:MAG: redoxin domain-containing protein [Bacteroidales bacterium]|nr:redoxin domain-containing protein [Bacteroidales bacterium]
MKWLKSAFISLFLSYLIVLLIIATYVLLSEPFSWGWLGVEISVLFPFIYYFWSYVQPKPRTGRLSLVSSLILAGFVITMIPAFTNNNEVGKTAVWLSALTYLFWFLYVNWYSKMDRTYSQFLKEGLTLPEFQLKTLDNKILDFSTLRGKKCLMLFYSGNWSPHCMAQINELVKYAGELEKRGVEAYIISSQPEVYSRKLAQKHKAMVHFFSDPENRAAKKLGILHKSGTPAGLHLFGYQKDTAYPTVIVCDEEGKVLFAHETNNYRYRPDPRLFLKVLDEHGKG